MGAKTRGRLFGIVLLGTVTSANANLISNGTFDTDLAGWSFEGTIPTLLGLTARLTLVAQTKKAFHAYFRLLPSLTIRKHFS